MTPVPAEAARNIKSAAAEINKREAYAEQGGTGSTDF